MSDNLDNLDNSDHSDQNDKKIKKLVILDLDHTLIFSSETE